MRDLDLLFNIKNSLYCGVIETVSTRPKADKFVVYKLDNIINNIIPFLDNYNLQAIKKSDYSDIRKVAIILSKSDKSTLDENTLLNIIAIEASMNINKKY